MELRSYYNRGAQGGETVYETIPERLDGILNDAPFLGNQMQAVLGKLIDTLADKGVLTLRDLQVILERPGTMIEALRGEER